MVLIGEVMSDERISYEVANLVLELATTMGEGLDHIQQQLSELRIEESWSMLEDILVGLKTITQSLRSYDPINSSSQLQESEAIMRQEFLNIVEAYPFANIEYLNNILTLRLLPAYHNWNKILREILSPYTVQ